MKIEFCFTKRHVDNIKLLVLFFLFFSVAWFFYPDLNISSNKISQIIADSTGLEYTVAQLRLVAEEVCLYEANKQSFVDDTELMDSPEELIAIALLRWGRVPREDELHYKKLTNFFGIADTSRYTTRTDLWKGSVQALKNGEIPIPNESDVGVLAGEIKKLIDSPKNSQVREKIKKRQSGAAPVSASNLREREALDYIERYASVAQVEMRKFGIPASISLAQGLVESRAGHSTLARRNNNHFGMKCFSKKCRKGHCSNFTDDHHKDFFRIYSNAWESWRAHSQMLASGRYTTLKKYGKDYRNWAYGLKTLGYATDRNYAEKLIGMIEKYGLQKYD